MDNIKNTLEQMKEVNAALEVSIPVGDWGVF